MNAKKQKMTGFFEKKIDCFQFLEQFTTEFFDTADPI